MAQDDEGEGDFGNQNAVNAGNPNQQNVLTPSGQAIPAAQANSGVKIDSLTDSQGIQYTPNASGQLVSPTGQAYVNPNPDFGGNGATLNSNNTAQPASYAQNIAAITAKANAEAQAKINQVHAAQGIGAEDQQTALNNIGFTPTPATPEEIAAQNPATNTGAAIQQGFKNIAPTVAGNVAAEAGSTALGAAIGSVIPGAGTVAGAGVGAGVGVVGAAVGGFISGYFGAGTAQQTANVQADYKGFLASKQDISALINDVNAGADPTMASNEYQQQVQKISNTYAAMAISTKTLTGNDRSIAVGRMAAIGSFLANRGNIDGTDTAMRNAVLAPNPSKATNLLTLQDQVDLNGG